MDGHVVREFQDNRGGSFRDWLASLNRLGVGRSTKDADDALARERIDGLNVVMDRERCGGRE